MTGFALQLRDKPNASSASGAMRSLRPLLRKIQSLCSEKMWLGGGTLRDAFVGSPSAGSSDIDVLFCNKNEISESYEDDLEAKIIEVTGVKNLSVKNQARMGIVADGIRYKSVLQSVAAFPDASVALAASIYDPDQTVFIFAPYGLPSVAAPIEPTSRYLSLHGLGGYYSWLDRKRYESRFLGRSIRNSGREPLPLSQSFHNVSTL